MMLAMAYVLILAIVALEVPLALSLRQRLDDEVKQQARTSANVVSVLAASAIERGDDVALESVVKLTSRDVRGRVVVVDEQGDVVADSAGAAGAQSNISGRPEIKAALAGRTVQIRRQSDSLNRELLATAVPIFEEGRTEGAVRITQDVADVSDAFGRTLAGLALIGLAVLAVGLLAGAFIARQIARPLRHFEDAARAVTEGDLSARAPVEGSSEQRELARAFNEMTDRLAGSIEAQSRFVADASHQLRTPLTGLRLRLEEARARCDDESVGVELDRGIDEVDRLAKTVEELLVLSQSGERDSHAQRIDLPEFVEQLQARWTPIARARGIDLSATTEGAGVVTASQSDLDRVFDALIENAVDYSADGGAIEIALVDSAITVRDHGVGLSDYEEQVVFERFHRGSAGSSRAGGTGLGLSIARELARRWGADVRIENADGGGAIATVRFEDDQ